MSRRKAAQKREILPDPLYKSKQVAKFINIVMNDGKKSVAEKIVYRAFEIVYASLKSSDPASAAGVLREDEKAREFIIEKFQEVMTILSPQVEVVSTRVGGATYQVPCEVRPARKIALAMRWLAEFANKRSEKTMIERLAYEILDALKEAGGAVRKRNEVLKMAKANQALAHYSR